MREGQPDSEIPQLSTSFYLLVERSDACISSGATFGDPRRGHCQVGSLAGAARLLKTTRRPILSSMRTEISCGPKGEKLG